jgi:hypothetical protein
MGPQHGKLACPGSRARRHSGLSVGLCLTLLVTTSVALISAAPPPATVSAAVAHSLPAAHARSAPSTPHPILGDVRAPGGRAVYPAASFTLGESAETPSAVALNWTQPATIGFGSYTVLVSANGSAGSFATVAVLSGNAAATTYVATALTPGGTYYWMVNVSAFVGSGSSNVIQVVQPALAYLTFWAPTATSAQLNWSDSASYGSPISFSSFTVFEGVNGATPVAVTNINDQATRSFTITGLSPGSSYIAYLNTTDCLSGCGSAVPNRTTTESNIVTFGTPLPLSVSVVATRTLVDTGQSDLFLCTPSGGVSPFTFAWNFGNGSFSPGGSSLAHAFASSGIQNITCRVTDSTSAKSTAATSVFVNPSPTLQLSVNRSAVDIGQNISFICAASGGTAPVVVAWTLGDGGTLPVGNGTHAFAASGHYSPECTAKDATSTSVGGSVAVAVSPTLVLHASASALAAAPGTLLNFHVSASNGSGGYYGYRWTFGDLAASYPGANVTHSYATTANFTVVAHAKDSNGAIAADTIVVDISAIQILAQSGPASVRAGGTVSFSGSAIGGGGAPYNFTWRFGDGSEGFGAAVSHPYDAKGSYAAVLVVTDALGANSSTTLGPIAVTVAPGPTPWLTSTTIALLVILGLVLVAIGVYVWRRHTARLAFNKMQGRVPPAGTDDVAKGAKVCSNCGVSNLPIRQTCTNCGRPLRRAPFG